MLPDKTFDPHISLLKLKIVRLVVGIDVGLVAAICIAIVGSSWESLNWDFTYRGFNHAVSMFQVPLGILALLIPVLAVFASNHRSEQTRVQLLEAIEQNRLSTYFSHRREFESIVTDSKDNYPRMFVATTSTYMTIYPFARRGDYHINPKYLVQAEEVVQEIAEVAKQIVGGDDEVWINAAKQVYRHSFRTCGITLAGPESTFHASMDKEERSR